MSNGKKIRSTLLCPRCRRLVSRTAPQCPTCGLKNPGSRWKDNIFTRSAREPESLLRILIGVNVVMFVLSLVIDPRAIVASASPFGFLTPSSNSLLVLGSTGTIPLFQLERWWTLVAASYLHGSMLHILFNMIALYQLGPLIIREYGGSRMFIIYTVSGIGGYLLSAFFGVRFTIGASAAVCGLIGAALYYGKSRGGSYGQAVYSQIGGWAIAIFVFGFLVPGINNFGHGGGMLTGALVGWALGYQEKAKETYAVRILNSACILVTGLILVWAVINGALYLLL